MAIYMPPLCRKKKVIERYKYYFFVIDHKMNKTKLRFFLEQNTKIIYIFIMFTMLIELQHLPLIIIVNQHKFKHRLFLKASMPLPFKIR